MSKQAEEFRIWALQLAPRDEPHWSPVLEQSIDAIAKAIETGECSFDPETAKLTLSERFYTEPASVYLTKKEAIAARKAGFIP